MIVNPMEDFKNRQKAAVHRVLFSATQKQIAANVLNCGIAYDDVEIEEFSFGIRAKVASSSHDKFYTSSIYTSGSSICTCPYNTHKRKPCKHIFIAGMKYLLSE